MHWPNWHRTDEHRLACYAVELSAQLLPRIERVGEFYARPDGPVALAEHIYNACASLEIDYTLELFSYHQKSQRIRRPQEVLGGLRHGTCLDLALVFCGACLYYRLVPWLVLYKGHAFAMVSRQFFRHSGRADTDAPEVTDLADGMLDIESADRLKTWVAERRLLPVECTGFVATKPPDGGTPTGQRTTPRLSFADAVAAGEAQLRAGTHPFWFALDVDYVQGNDYKPYDPGPLDVHAAQGRPCNDDALITEIRAILRRFALFSSQEKTRNLFLQSALLALYLDLLRLSGSANDNILEIIAYFRPESNCAQLLDELLRLLMGETRDTLLLGRIIEVRSRLAFLTKL